MKGKLLLIDDDNVFLNSLKAVVEDIGHDADVLDNPTEAVDKSKAGNYDLILLDIKMPGVNGIDLMKRFLADAPDTPVVIVSGQSTISIAVEAMKIGAYDFVEKPIERQRIEPVIKNALKVRSLLLQNKYLSETLGKETKLVGSSREIEEIRKHILTIAPSDAKVLILGETGTGKEIIAKAIHQNSSRNKGPYIKINCAAIPATLLESELFGHAKGSFTGASEEKEGKFYAARNGTLFLDEIGDMNLNLQAKILRFLEEGEIEVVGKSIPVKVDVRIIAATNQSLEQLTREGKFRNDLYHRLNVVTIKVPPLRQRKSDIEDLAYHFLKSYNDEYNKSIQKITDRALGVMRSYDWPGNVRELRNFIEKLVIYTTKDNVDIGDILNLFNSKIKVEHLDSDMGFLTYKEAKREFEKSYFLEALNQHNGNISETARTLGLDRSNLFKKIKALGIETNSDQDNILD